LNVNFKVISVYLLILRIYWRSYWTGAYS